ELRRLVRDLQRAQIGEAEARLLAEVHLRDEELHALLEIDAESTRRAGRHAVLVLDEPLLEPVALLRGENEDVVLADGVARLDRHAERTILPRGHLVHRDARGRTFGHLHGLELPPSARILVEVL